MFDSFVKGLKLLGTGIRGRLDENAFDVDATGAALDVDSTGVAFDVDAIGAAFDVVATLEVVVIGAADDVEVLRQNLKKSCTCMPDKKINIRYHELCYLFRTQFFVNEF